MREKNLLKILPRPENENTKQDISNTREETDLISVGRVTRTHGLRGLVKIFPYTDSLERFDSLHSVFMKMPDNQLIQCDVEHASIRNGCVYMKFFGIDDCTGAERFKGAWVSVRREESPKLPPDRYYIFDLIGAEVINQEGEKIGAVSRVDEYPANAVLVVKSGSEEVWIPAVKEFVTAVDLKKKRLVVRTTDGLPVYEIKGK